MSQTFALFHSAPTSMAYATSVFWRDCHIENCRTIYWGDVPAFNTIQGCASSEGLSYGIGAGGKEIDNMYGTVSIATPGSLTRRDRKISVQGMMTRVDAEANVSVLFQNKALCPIL